MFGYGMVEEARDATALVVHGSRQRGSGFLTSGGLVLFEFHYEFRFLVFGSSQLG
ncbi:hypothetical protein Hanom_Chr05g00417821 [Helianthus anomalus]